MIETYSTVILADGDFPSTPRTMRILKQAERIICCDGAAEKLLRFGLEPDAIVGDLDSLAYQLRQKFADKIIHVAEQESNDLSKAFRYCRSKNYENVVFDMSNLNFMDSTGIGVIIGRYKILKQKNKEGLKSL